MKYHEKLARLGHKPLVDNITREILDDGTLRRSSEPYSPSPTDVESRSSMKPSARPPPTSKEFARRPQPACPEGLFIELALETCAAPRPVQTRIQRTKGIDGWVSMEVSPLLANDTQGTIDAALRVHKQGNRPNLYVKIPGTPAGVPAIEAAIFAGIPINCDAVVLADSI